MWRACAAQAGASGARFLSGRCYFSRTAGGEDTCPDELLIADGNLQIHQAEGLLFVTQESIDPPPHK
jgi:hypothetical protein